MTSRKDKLEEIDDYISEKKIEDGIRRGLNRWAHTICMTATSALITIFYTLGNFVYEKWLPLQAAVKAFLAANKQ